MGLSRCGQLGPASKPVQILFGLSVCEAGVLRANLAIALVVAKLVKIESFVHVSIVELLVNSQLALRAARSDNVPECSSVHLTSS
jgi:hypothetical protein